MGAPSRRELASGATRQLPLEGASVSIDVDFGATTVLGYPRIGPRRELKWALEAYWAGRCPATDLLATGRRLRTGTWTGLAAAGLAAVPSNTFSYYDHVLDMATLVGAVADRYQAAGATNVEGNLDVTFAMARGTEDLAPLRMTKWFDTNYHYLVPEIGPATKLRLANDKPLAEVREARQLGLTTRPVLLGPVTFLLLSQAAPGSRPGFAPLQRLPDLLAVYADLFASLASEGVAWVQLDEPALVADRTAAELDAVAAAYRALGELDRRPRLFVASYFGELGPALPVLADAPVDAIGLDLVRGRDAYERADLDALSGKTVVAGVVSGRDVWRTDMSDALDLLRALRRRVGQVVVGTSCSLLHVPYDLGLDTDLDPALRERLAFARQKVAELVVLGERLASHPMVPGPAVSGLTSEIRARREEPVAPLASSRRPVASQAPGPARAERAQSGTAGRSPYPVRAAVQARHLDLPPLPVTTTGSFPQTGDLRAARAALASGDLPAAAYEDRVRAEIRRVVDVQERLGLDVLVHGEPERNDMVQYFAEHLDGFATTRQGWVQSYGSRCTRPPILHGDVRRPSPITVGWATYAQSLTAKPVKGMLTGPVTIVAWSFVRRDVALSEVVRQVAAAVRDEVRDLEAAGISIIQVDEPALRELLPLRRDRQAEYLDLAVAAYRLATSGASDRTQIHTHLCYSDADEIVAAIDALDADVTSVESARSGGRILSSIASYTRGLGPGVYDIHSPRVPSADEVAELLAAALRVVPAQRLWVNPDCGLKTRTYDQVEAALANVVAAAHRLRARAG
jgi:5-methyltetrahydropteroyltriglutamate--homocysteine methyltransferase